jgi:hypothetical protein
MFCLLLRWCYRSIGGCKESTRSRPWGTLIRNLKAAARLENDGLLLDLQNTRLESSSVGRYNFSTHKNHPTYRRLLSQSSFWIDAADQLLSEVQMLLFNYVTRELE